MKMVKRFSQLLSGVMAMSLLLTGCGGSAQSGGDTEKSGIPETIKLALVCPLTGDAAQYGISFQQGVETYLEEYNAAGGLNGSKVEVEVYDDRNDAKETVNIANIILADGTYDAVIGPYSSTCALAMAEVLDEEKILCCSPTCSHMDYVANYDYTFRIASQNTMEGIAAATYMKGKYNSEKVACIYPNNDWGIAVNAAFCEEAEKLGMEVVADDNFILGQTKDFSALLTKAKNAGADSMYVATPYIEGSQIIMQAQGICPDMHLLASGSVQQPELIDIVGDAGKDVLILCPIHDPTEELAKKHMDKYGEPIDNAFCSAYNTVMMALQGLEKAGSVDPDAWKEGITSIGTFEGVNGMWTIDAETRNVVRSYYIYGIVDGEFKLLESPDYLAFAEQ